MSVPSASNAPDPNAMAVTNYTNAPEATDAPKTPTSAKMTLEKLKHSSKSAFDKGWAAFEKLGVPVNKLTNKIGSEAFWPTDLGQESDKAARILKSFCKDGFYKEQPDRAATSSSGQPVPPGPKSKPKVLMKIPQKVIQNCVGLAIFSVMRAGLWVSGAGGSGVLIARKEDGSWGPPSGILVHTLGGGFLAGIDIYDCVIVINNRQALEAFKKMRLSLGGEFSAVAGPLGTGAILESELLKNRKPVFTYVKSRGFYIGLQIDGTIILERNDENARFYGERRPIADILAGRITNIPSQTHLLMEIAKQAEGRTDVDPGVIEQVDRVPVPSEMDVESLREPTAKERVHFALSPEYDTQSVQSAAGYYPPEKQDYVTPRDPASVSGYASPAHEQAPAYPPRPQDVSATDAGSGLWAEGKEQVSEARHPDASLYDAPTEISGPYSPLQSKPVARTNSGFAAPPGPPPGIPEQSEPAFIVPPAKSEKRYEKRDPDAPPPF